MKKLITICLALFFSKMLLAQTVAGFENFNLPPNSFLNNADTADAFSSGGILLPNNYNPAFASWDGWAISNTTDTVTPGFFNESSAIAGGGAEGSATYAVSYVFGSSNMRLKNRGTVNGLYITNTTYAYLSIKDGDAFAKKFGGITGNDPDFFLLKVKKFFNGLLAADSVAFYLADYRFANNAQDYIVDDWTWLDLSPLGAADSLQFTLSSSDIGAFGMNTPAYFAVDQVTTTDLVSVKNIYTTTFPIEVFPNPAAEFLTLRIPEKNGSMKAQIINCQGQMVAENPNWTANDQFDVRFLPAGAYIIRVWQGSQAGYGKFIKF